MFQVQDYVLIKSLGKGSFGEVYLTKKEKNSKLFATKRIPCSKLSSKDFKKYLDNEIKIMRKLQHENIIKFQDCYQTENNIYIIMEYINGGSLSEFLSKYKLKHGHPFPQKMIQHFVKQIVQGLIYIHSKGIIHRDIKLENILIKFPFDNTSIDENNYTLSKVKIIDFGLATEAQLAKSIVGSPIYMDPNILKKYDKSGGIEKFKLYDKKADIWSLGAVTYEMLTGENIFKASNLPELLNKVKKGDYYLEVKSLSNEILSFLNGMLQNDPKKRKSALELSKHPFLTIDPDDFKTIDTSKIDYKIDKHGILALNIINNETILKVFPFHNINIKLDLISDKFSEKYKNEIVKEEPKKDNIEKNDKSEEEQKIEENTDKIYTNEDRNNDNQEEKIEPTPFVSNILPAKTFVLDNDVQSAQELEPQKDFFDRAISQEIKPIKIDDKIKKEDPPLKPKISEEIKQKKDGYQVHFEVQRIDQKYENVHINISFLVNETNTLIEDVYLTSENGYKKDWIWTFHSNDWRNIDNNNENFIMKIKYDNSFKHHSYQLERIKLGKPLFFKSNNYIKFTLTPIPKNSEF